MYISSLSHYRNETLLKIGTDCINLVDDGQILEISCGSGRSYLNRYISIQILVRPKKVKQKGKYSCDCLKDTLGTGRKELKICPLAKEGFFLLFSITLIALRKLKRRIHNCS